MQSDISKILEIEVKWRTRIEDIEGRVDEFAGGFSKLWEKGKLRVTFLFILLLFGLRN